MSAFDLDLAQQLSTAGPRYTSYPPAPQFHAGFGAAAHAAAIRAAGAAGRPLSLYLHVPFCAQLCLYCGCHTEATRSESKKCRYTGHLRRELDLVADLLAEGGSERADVVQIHWGGGTPTALGPTHWRSIMAHLCERFDVAHRAEISVECDPRALSAEDLAAFADFGVSRLSFGVQSLDPTVQKAIGRVQSFAQIAQAFDDARRAGMSALAVDLIYGLPYQNEGGFAATIDAVLQLDPDRLSVFSYAHVPWLKPHQRAIPTDALPGPREKLRLFAVAYDRLTAAGYQHIGLDHFARPDDPLSRAQAAGTLQRNFQGYSTHAGTDLLGLGTSAISQLDGAYAQNTKNLVAYYAALDDGLLPTERGLALTPDDHLRRYVIHTLMCQFSLSFRDVEARFPDSFRSASFADTFAAALEALAPLEDLGVVQRLPDYVYVPGRGRPFVRNVAMAFDAYLPAHETVAAAPRYSQTI